MTPDLLVAIRIGMGEEATVSLALLEISLPDEIPPLRYVEHWANCLAAKIGCKATIHAASDVVTFYPRSRNDTH